MGFIWGMCGLRGWMQGAEGRGLATGGRGQRAEGWLRAGYKGLATECIRLAAGGYRAGCMGA